MRTLEPIREWIVGRYSFPVSNYFLNRKGIWSGFRQLQKTERAKTEVMGALRLERLRRVLAHAQRWVPFYRERFRLAGFDPRDVRSLDDLRRLPRLTREDVIEHLHDLVDERFRHSISAAEDSTRMAGQPIAWARFRRNKLVKNNTTGSTGTPTVLFEDGSTSALNWVHHYRLKAWFNLSPGASEARIARLSTQFMPTSKVLATRKLLWNQMALPGMNLSEKEYALCVERLVRFQPKVIFGITTALTALADYIRQTGIPSSWRPKLVITWAAPVLDYERALLGEVFDCPVSNIYGSREVGHVALECPHRSLHLNHENYVLECDDSQAGDFDRTSGDVLITPLIHSPMPFIRYDIGDLAELSTEPCACGRTLPVIKSLLGRSSEQIYTEDGQMIGPNFWTRVFMQSAATGNLHRTVKQFQVVYRADGSYLLRIVRREAFTDETERRMRECLREQFSPSTRIEFEYVSQIPCSPSGKFPMIVNQRPAASVTYSRRDVVCTNGA